ncbi:MAG: magnesium transporter CorA family protein [Vulcanimicrobiota bacterium]
MAENRFFQITHKGKLEQKSSFAEALASLKDGVYIWLDFSAPTKEDLMSLVEPLGIHPLAVEDCLDEDQVPKIEDYPTNTYILFNRYLYEKRELQIDELNIFIGKNFILTVNRHKGNSRSFFEKLDDAISKDMANIKKGPDFLLHLVLDHTVDSKVGAIEALQDEIDDAEESILKEPQRFKPEELIHLRRQLLSMRKSLFHEREIMVKICRRDSPFITEKSIYHFRDVYDHMTKFFETTEMYREMIGSLMEMYLSMINNHMANISQRTNQVMRRLTLITTIFMPLTLLAGIGGMSEWSMMTGPQNWMISYPLFLLAMVAIGTLNYYLLKKFEAKCDRPEELNVY